MDTEKKSNLASYYKIARNCAVVTACFVAIVSIILFISFVQLALQDPVRSPQLEKLIEQVHTDTPDSVTSAWSSALGALRLLIMIPIINAAKIKKPVCIYFLFIFIVIILINFKTCTYC